MVETFTPDEMREMAVALERDVETPRSCGCGSPQCGWCQCVEQADKSAAMLRYAADTLQQRDEACEWKQDEVDRKWAWTECRRFALFIDNAQVCPFCGRPLKEVPFNE